MKDAEENSKKAAAAVKDGEKKDKDAKDKAGDKGLDKKALSEAYAKA